MDDACHQRKQGHSADKHSYGHQRRATENQSAVERIGWWTLQHVKLVSRDRSAFRLERRGEQGQSEAEKSDTAAKVGDAVTRSKRSEFSVHT